VDAILSKMEQPCVNSLWINSKNKIMQIKKNKKRISDLWFQCAQCIQYSD
jgi:hypothetical protein